MNVIVNNMIIGYEGCHVIVNHILIEFTNINKQLNKKHISQECSDGFHCSLKTSCGCLLGVVVVGSYPRRHWESYQALT